MRHAPQQHQGEGAGPTQRGWVDRPTDGRPDGERVMCEQQSTCGYLSVFIVVGLGSSVKRNVLRKAGHSDNNGECCPPLLHIVVAKCLCVCVGGGVSLPVCTITYFGILCLRKDLTRLLRRIHDLSCRKRVLRRHAYFHSPPPHSPGYSHQHSSRRQCRAGLPL